MILSGSYLQKQFKNGLEDPKTLTFSITIQAWQRNK